MKRFATVSFLLVTILLSSATVAQIQYYGIDVNILDTGMSETKFTITFTNQTNNFRFNIFGRIENFNATSNAGPVVCKVESGGASFVDCILDLTQEKRSIDINFRTSDFVRRLDNSFYFNGDFSLREDIDQVFVSVKIPEGMALVSGENAITPEGSTTISDGRRIIALWKMDNVKKDEMLRFQIFYETVQPLFQIRFRHVVLFGFVLAVVVSFILVSRRKPEQVILSVLDEFERKIMDVINSHGGTINQKKVVQETNLSKAKVSRVVKSLQERGLIEAERRGRTNILKTVKKRFKYF